MSNTDDQAPVSDHRQEPTHALVTAGLDHSWKWVEVCTNRQAQSFNLFLVLNAFLTAGYFAAVGARLPVAGLVTATAAVLAAIGFGYEDRRIEKYIAVGLRALMAFEERLSLMVDCPEIRMTESVQSSRSARVSVAPVGYATAAVLWTAGTVFTVYHMA